jgi:hypothetical protein
MVDEMMSYLSHANLTMVTSSWKIVDFMSGKVQSCLDIRGEHSRQNWPIVTTKLKLKSIVSVYVFLLVSAICFRFIFCGTMAGAVRLSILFVTLIVIVVHSEVQ